MRTGFLLALAWTSPSTVHGVRVFSSDSTDSARNTWGTVKTSRFPRQTGQSRQPGMFLVLVLRNPADIYIASVHIGKNDLGNMFGTAYVDFDQHILGPFHKFL